MNSNRLCYRVEYAWYLEVPVEALISFVPTYSGQWMAGQIVALPRIITDLLIQQRDPKRHFHVHFMSPIIVLCLMMTP
jgi:hypothetical protein